MHKHNKPGNLPHAFILHVPEEDRVKFKETWSHLYPTLEVLHSYLAARHKEAATVRKDDFANPNHYALLAYEAGKQAAYEEIMQLLPSSSK